MPPSEEDISDDGGCWVRLACSTPGVESPARAAAAAGSDGFSTDGRPYQRFRCKGSHGAARGVYPTRAAGRADAGRLFAGCQSAMAAPGLAETCRYGSNTRLEVSVQVYAMQKLGGFGSGFFASWRLRPAHALHASPQVVTALLQSGPQWQRHWRQRARAAAAACSAAAAAVARPAPRPLPRPPLLPALQTRRRPQRQQPSQSCTRMHTPARACRRTETAGCSEHRTGGTAARRPGSHPCTPGQLHLFCRHRRRGASSVPARRGTACAVTPPQCSHLSTRRSAECWLHCSSRRRRRRRTLASMSAAVGEPFLCPPATDLLDFLLAAQAGETANWERGQPTGRLAATASSISSKRHRIQKFILVLAAAG